MLYYRLYKLDVICKERLNTEIKLLLSANMIGRTHQVSGDFE